MKNLKLFVPIVIAIFIIMNNLYERTMAGPGFQAYNLVIIYMTSVVLACLVLYLLFNQNFFKFIAIVGYVIQLLLTAILVYNVFQTPNIKLDNVLPFMALFLEALRIVAIYCLISHKHIPRNTSAI